MKSLNSFAVVASVVAALVLAANPYLFSACPNQKVYAQPCPEPPTVTFCNQAKLPCTDAKQQDLQTNDFGCQDNGTNKTQCLDAANQQGNLVLCYIEYVCKSDGIKCVVNLATATNHYRLKKVTVLCVGS